MCRLLKLITAEYPEFVIFPEKVVDNDNYGIGFQKGASLTDSFSQAIREFKKRRYNGCSSEKWFSGDQKTMKKLIGINMIIIKVLMGASIMPAVLRIYLCLISEMTEGLKELKLNWF